MKKGVPEKFKQKDRSQDINIRQTILLIKEERLAKLNIRIQDRSRLPEIQQSPSKSRKYRR